MPLLTLHTAEEVADAGCCAGEIDPRSVTSELNEMFRGGAE